MKDSENNWYRTLDGTPIGSVARDDDDLVPENVVNWTPEGSGIKYI